MTKKQLKHYLKGGKFEATYLPTKMDISEEVKNQIGKRIVVYQNIEIAPIVSIKSYMGQHRFNTQSIYGWIPEEDFQGLTIIDDFVEHPEVLPVYIYRMTYATQEQVYKDFHCSINFDKFPYLVERVLRNEDDDYILSLLCSSEILIEKVFYDGAEEELDWKTVQKSKMLKEEVK